ncbi:MAG: replication-associated recombination protein A [Ruminococcaceae bacterium]|nr:replication-associated recombination protein A [Oscillospiraceae bacterium]
MNTPLADRLRPQNLNEVVGQRHLLDDNAPLKRLLDNGILPNMIFYGPPGTGKTTVAQIIASQAKITFQKLNATSASGSDIKEVLQQSNTFFGADGILLYIDEIQYLNKKQQQTLLEYIEDGRVTLIASTTENPYFYVHKAILSRSSVFEFKPVSRDDIFLAVRRALDVLNNDNPTKKIISDDAFKALCERSGGDVRCSLNILELSYYISGDEITVENVISVSGNNYMTFDRDDDVHFELLSGLQKSIRGSDENAALFYLARLLDGGDLLSACRRLLVIASEDIGLAYPMAATIVNSCVDSAIRLGMPEARIPLAQAVVLLATSPKSNSSYLAFDMALEDVKSGKGRDMPEHLKNNHCPSEGTTYDKYKYPHDFKNHYVKQQYLPDDLKNRVYYTFGDNKTEQAAYEYRKKITDSDA